MMTKYEKLTTMAFIGIALIGTNKGWLPGLWAVIFVAIGCIGLEKWAINKCKKNDEES